MGRNISIAISVQDNFTKKITTMREASHKFNKDLADLSSKLDSLNKKKISLKVDTAKANEALRKAETRFAKTGEAAANMSTVINQINVDHARTSLNLLENDAHQTEKTLHSLDKTIGKMGNKAGISGVSGGGKAGISAGGKAGLIGTLAEAGIARFSGDIAQIADAAIGSAFGSNTNTMVQSTIGSAISGAAMGSMIGGLPGAAVGAIAGGVMGFASGKASNYSKEDDIFKSSVRDQYEAVKQQESDTLTRGIGIAGSREQTQLAFGRVLGSDETAKDFLAEMADFAVATPFDYDQLAAISKTMLANGYKQNEVFEELVKIGDAGMALGMSSEDMNYVAASLGSLRSTGQTTLESLSPLLERGIPVFEYLAKASGKTEAQIQDMVSNGLIPGVEAAKAIADYMGTEHAGNMEKQNQSYQGLMSNLEDAQGNMDAAMGEGYTHERQKGIQAQIDYFEGESGEKLKEANRMIGEWKASLENDHEAAIRNSMDEMMDSDEYKQAAAEGNRVEMGKLLAEAQAKGENEYKASEGYQLQLATDQELIKKIREDQSLKKEYWNTGKALQEEFEKGRRAVSAASPYGYGDAYDYGWNGQVAGSVPGSGKVAAYGISYVPYDNFPALLHEGERVLTASEARALKGSGASNISITGNSFIIREEADIGKIARELARNMARASALAI
ncbi:tape measure domain protein [Desulfitobacterium dehalogenans ATCC 51507]|uniref:Tape measure domain protein n=1 Tax=Desulfitobacterium dehalogenans (strain ATCC 51507 / DSM 9161 / JW/IU-DC1) TaxID=756499 RepID=I4AEJ5_DESDJ|nr:tape measure protein [Desulfitobacterium dehalogenans]AFM02380.1 tape measure domain protein [Desulfitobacterium dehalogenans ATCC 51507]